MSAGTGIASGGEGSALPGPRRRQKKKPKKHPAEKRDQDRAVMFTLQPDGSFRAANEAAKEWLKARGLRVGDRTIHYVYKIHDAEAESRFRKAHKFAKYLRENSEDFNGMTDHEVLKQLQLDFGIACVRTKMLLPRAAQELYGTRYMTALQPRSIAPAFMDAGEFERVWKQLAEATAGKYFGVIDAGVVEEMLKLMGEAG